MASEIKILGTTEEVTTCDCCGRDNLKHTVAIEVDGQGPNYYGVVCAARIYGMESKAIRRQAREIDAEKEREAYRAAVERRAEETQRWERWLWENGDGMDSIQRIQSLGGFEAARAAYLMEISEVE